jgi:hypothetical protein
LLSEFLPVLFDSRRILLVSLLLLQLVLELLSLLLVLLFDINDIAVVVSIQPLVDGINRRLVQGPLSFPGHSRVFLVAGFVLFGPPFICDHLSRPASTFSLRRPSTLVILHGSLLSIVARASLRIVVLATCFYTSASLFRLQLKTWNQLDTAPLRLALRSSLSSNEVLLVYLSSWFRTRFQGS